MSGSHDQQKPEITGAAQEALRFINTTSVPVFLTGKAGTGKTTFLRNLSNHTHKKFIIVAPTGIAALNAGGVTIHSQFQLPFGMFIPDKDMPAEQLAGGSNFNQRLLARQSPLKDSRRQMLRSINLLVIDEVSMLRADLLDAIDYRLKAARGNFHQPFGGVQLLFIGDLFQLPPVSKREEETLFRQYYGSPWFFSAHCLRSGSMVYIELDKIFRQRDETFIRVLNNLRNDCVTPQDLELLNRHYRPDLTAEEMRNCITLTTHNQQADELNQRALAELTTAPAVFKANVRGEFPESMFPALPELTLKTGAQVMFIRNDIENKLYVNGKIGTVTDIDDGEVTVMLSDSGDLLNIKPVVWENKSFTLKKDSQEIEETIAGTFEQIPLKLAWAITIHKSQGLTFDRAIIDPARAFTDGQVYVALSRLRSLDGLVLRSRIEARTISTDRTVVSFTGENDRPDTLPAKATARQREFIGQLIVKTFDFEGIVHEIENHSRREPETAGQVESFGRFTSQLEAMFIDERGNTDKLRQQLIGLLEAGNIPYMLERVEKGSAYYLNLLWKAMEGILAETDHAQSLKRVKGYLTLLTDLDQLVSLKIAETEQARTLIGGILSGETRFDFSQIDNERIRRRLSIKSSLAELNREQRKTLKTIKKGKKPAEPVQKVKIKVGQGAVSASVDLSLGLFKAGLTVEQIASERGLVPSTIFGHLSKAVAMQKLSVHELMDSETLELMMAAIGELPKGFTSLDLFNRLDGKYDYGKVKLALIHHELLKQEGKA